MESLNKFAVAELVPSFPAVTCCVQTNITTGQLPCKHGVVGNGLLLRKNEPIDCDDDRPVWLNAERLPYLEMWTAPNQCIGVPQIWDELHKKSKTSSVWFPLHSKHSRADFVCTPAPIHNPDGSESLWCYTKPVEMYGKLRDEFGHFPLQNFWGPLSGIASTEWILKSACWSMSKQSTDFFYIYVPHLDYASQKFGANSNEAATAVSEIDSVLLKFFADVASETNIKEPPVFLVAGEYAITDVSHVTFPNRILREMGLIEVEQRDGREYVEPLKCNAFAVCDHQFSHVHIKDADRTISKNVAERFRRENGIAEVLVGEDDMKRYGINHRRSGEIILISEQDSWQAYYYWNENSKAPEYANKVDIHRKPGYDPLELFRDKSIGIPFDTTLIKGSHGTPTKCDEQKTVLLSSAPKILNGKKTFTDIDVFNIVNGWF
jgi:hypothetical protein